MLNYRGQKFQLIGDIKKVVKHFITLKRLARGIYSSLFRLFVTDDLKD